MFQPKKEYYPAFLSAFKGQPFDSVALQQAFQQAKIKGKVRAQATAEEFFAEFQLDADHWNYHQRILFDDVLFRLLSEGYLHPTVHPVAAIYHDTEFYSFVFPFIHTAILKRMAVAIRTDNSASVKLIMQWIEPFGTYFHQAFFQMVEFIAEDILIELNSAQINRRVLSFDTYSKLSPTMMHLLNRLPAHSQPYRDRFAHEVMHVAVWLHNEMKVFTQPGGMLTRLKLLNCSPQQKIQIEAQLKQWESEKVTSGDGQFNVKHLLWIIPAVFILAYGIWRNTDWGRTTEDIMEDQAEALYAERIADSLRWDSIDRYMDTIDLNGVIARELILFHSNWNHAGTPIPADLDPNRLDRGSEPYKHWLRPGRKIIPAMESIFGIRNESDVDMVVFLRQKEKPFTERAYYVRRFSSIEVFDTSARDYTMRFYAGTGWTDSLVTADYDKKLKKAGVPSQVHNEFPATTDLRGRFRFPVKTLQSNLESVECRSVAAYESAYMRYVVIKGNADSTYYDL